MSTATIDTAEVVEVDEIAPLPPLQADMARMIQAGRLFYAPALGRWYDGDATEPIGRERGRALRAMRAAGLIVVPVRAVRDARRAVPVTLSEVALSRLSLTS